MPASILTMRAVSAGFRAHAEAGFAALWSGDARVPHPEDISVVFDGSLPRIKKGGESLPFDGDALAPAKNRTVDLVFTGLSAVDLETVVPGVSRDRTILNCEDMVMEQSPFPEEACLCFWTAHWKDGSWHVTGCVTLAKPVLDALDMLEASGCRVRSVRRQPGANAPEWVAVPPWIRPGRRRIPRLPVWGICLAGAIVLAGAGMITTTTIRAGALDVAGREARVDRAMIARTRALMRQRETRRIGQVTSRERVALIGRLAQALPDKVSLESFTIDGFQVQIEGRGGTASDALRIVSTLEGLEDVRLSGDVQRADSGEVFVIEAMLESQTP